MEFYALDARGGRRRWNRIRAFIGLTGALTVAQSQAASIPWMPSASARQDIELLVDQGHLDLIVTHWPLPRGAVVQAIDRLPSNLPPNLEEAQARIRRALDTDTASQGTLRLQSRDDALGGFGDDSTRGSSIAIRSKTEGGAFVASRIGVRIDSISGLQEDTKLRLDDSALVTEALGVQLQAFSHRQWWGPGWQSSLTLSNNPPAFNGLGLQRASGSRSDSPWLAWMGPWNYDMFIAQTEDVSNPANPYFFAQRLTLKPFWNLEIGLTRTAQWGGRGREQTFRGFVHMLTGQGLNADTPAQQAADPANEEAGFDFRLTCPSGLRCATYLQLTGEDQAGVLPSKYLGLYGLEGWSADGYQHYFLEYAETGCRSPIGHPFLVGCAYRNYAYPQGYTDAGRWIGASVGPDSRLVTLGWSNVASGSSVRFSAGKVGSRVGTYTPNLTDPTTSGRLYALSAKQDIAWGSAILTPEFDWFHVAAANGGTRQLRVGATLTTGLDSAFESGFGGLGRALSGASSSSLEPLWVGAGLVVAAALLDRGVDNYAQAHAQNPSGRALGRYAKALPIAAFGLASASWALQSGSVQGDLALTALEAGVSAAVITEAAKYGIDRAGPTGGEGPRHFGGSRRDASFPSTHTAVAWAVMTPYAKYYEEPWLYGLAALTNAGRIASRDHWLSDTVAGAVAGYYLGDLFYRRSGAFNDTSGVHLWLTPKSIRITKEFD